MYLLDFPTLKLDYGILLLVNQKEDILKNHPENTRFIKLDDRYFLAEILDIFHITINDTPCCLYTYEIPFMHKSIESYWKEEYDWLKNYNYSIFLKGIKISFIFKENKITGIKNNSWTTFYKYVNKGKEEYFYNIPISAIPQKERFTLTGGDIFVYEINEQLVSKENE